MPLNFTGKESSTPEFEKLLEAKDGDKRVVVVASQEVVQDYGLTAVREKASNKYDAGQVDQVGRVRVFTSDF